MLVEFASASSAVLLGLLATWVAGDTLLHIAEFGAAPYARLQRTVLAGLEQLPVGVPLACMVGVVWSVTRAVRHREVTAIRSGGIPLRRALLPILIACLAIGVGVAFAEDRLLVPARVLVEVMEQELDGAPRVQPRYSNGRWWIASGPSVFSAADWDPAAGRLVDVTMLEYDASGRIARRIDALEARPGEGTLWRFAQARVFDFDRAGLKTMRAESLEVDLGIRGDEFERALSGVGSLSLHKLARRIREHTGSVESFAPLAVSFHSRLAQPLSVLILVLFAIPFAVGDVERGDSLARALLWSMGAAIAYWVVWTLALATGNSGAAPPALLVWGTTVAFLAAGGWRFRAISE